MIKNLAFVVFILLSTAISSYAQQYKDCEDPLILCGESPFTIEVTEGIGEIDSCVLNSCIQNEFKSTWIALNIIGDGDLVFEITPTDENTDIDFVVFQLDSDDCEAKTLIRCMASGMNVGQPDSINERCLGSTGLAFGETDIEELPGCSDGDNNFLAPISAIEGDRYMLMISDFSLSLDSFMLDIGGTAVIEDTSLFDVSQSGSNILVKTHALPGQSKLMMYSVNGAIMHEENVLGNELYLIDKSILSGTYFLVLRTSKSVYSETIIVSN